MLVSVATRPTLAAPSLAPPLNDLAIRLPGDVAQLTRASATHRRSVSTGNRATGDGVTVAVIDSGFADHPYYRDHGYRITRMAASDVTDDPTLDEDEHGTFVLAGVFACAPDAHVVAIKFDNAVTALNDAAANGAQVVSLSWGNVLAGTLTQLPTSDDSIPIYQTILTMIADGITVVAAAGNLGGRNHPAMMPDVIAVGGVAVDADDALAAWDGGSSFKSSIFKGRRVPDVCGVASKALVPLPPDADPVGWTARSGGTSLATAQVAGVAALLLQKCPTLTPQEVRDHLTATATDVKAGKSFMKNVAGKGRDLATGYGLVNALGAWNSVP
jgi:subtilisin family serine protease